MSMRRASPGGWLNEPEIERIKRQHGHMLCRECGAPVTGRQRRTFCSQACVDAWCIRTDPGRARRLVWQRDNGYCCGCGADLAGARNRDGKPVRMAPGTVWQCDHTKPVVEGGGECGLDNLRALCTACHRRETAELRRRMALGRRAAIPASGDLFGEEG